VVLLRLATALLALSISSAAFAQPHDCMVVPRQVADLAFGTSGVVERLLVDRGDPVRKGDALGYLDSAVEATNLAIAKARVAEVAALETARAQLVAAQSKLQRSRALESKQVMATSKLEEAEAEHESARLKIVEQEELLRLKALDVQRVEAALALRRIVSPFDGVVVDRHVAPGEYVENRRALTIAQIDPVYADVIAPSSMFAEVKKGQKVKVILQQPADLSVISETAVIDPYVDGASGTFRVRLAIANPDYAVVPGFRCRAEFSVPSR
jgi:cobalt-zinc-cadmium efflux system membrane fusion protein